MADPQREIRIGDAERTAAAQELGEHFAQGRLTPDEHQERLDRVLGARTAAELAPLFADLPGSPYQGRAYAGADRPPVGSDRPGGGRPYPARPFGRPPFGRPPYVDPRGRFGLLPFPLKLLLVLIVAAVVLTHLPLILIGLVVWVVLASKHRRWHSYGHGYGHSYRQQRT
jgi:hypothetical protein